MNFPHTRLKRLRKNNAWRALLQEHRLTCDDLIMPYFIVEGTKQKQTIKNMPGIYRLSIDLLIKELKSIQQLGIKAILLFGVPSKKDATGSRATLKNSLIVKAIKIIKATYPDLIIMTDICLCAYTSHGHCGVLKKKQIDNDLTLKKLSQMALMHAKAGADTVAPSAMIDGQVNAIRDILDKNHLYDTSIMAYSAKYASNFYGPFREAASSAPSFSDRKSYQMNMANSEEALREIKQDINEGADIVMVKPALSYLDIVAKAHSTFHLPLAVYNVSGEYAMVKQAAKSGIIDEKQIIFEILTSMKRAGASLIITYHSKEVATWLNTSH